MVVENDCLIWFVLTPFLTASPATPPLAYCAPSPLYSWQAFNRLTMSLSCGLCTCFPLSHQLFPWLSAWLTPQFRDLHQDHKASRSSPLSPWMSHYLGLFEFLSICITMFKEAQKVHMITRRNHLSVELEKNLALKFCNYTHYCSLVYFTIRSKKQWLSLPYGPFSENKSLDYIYINSLFSFLSSPWPGHNPNHCLAVYSLWL